MTTILLVESDQVAARALTHLLEQAGYRVRMVTREEEAIGAAREGGCQLALVDLSAPGLAGIAICRSLAEEGGPPVLVVSAETTPDERRAALAAGAGDYLVKPVPAKRLLAALSALAAKKAPTSPQTADAG